MLVHSCKREGWATMSHFIMTSSFKMQLKCCNVRNDNRHIQAAMMKPHTNAVQPYQHTSPGHLTMTASTLNPVSLMNLLVCFSAEKISCRRSVVMNGSKEEPQPTTACCRALCTQVCGHVCMCMCSCMFVWSLYYHSWLEFRVLYSRYGIHSNTAGKGINLVMVTHQQSNYHSWVFWCWSKFTVAFCKCLSKMKAFSGFLHFAQFGEGGESSDFLL